MADKKKTVKKMTDGGSKRAGETESKAASAGSVVSGPLDSTVRDLQDKFQNVSEEVTELASRGKETFEEVSDRAVEFYDEATSWISRNSQTLLTLGIGIAVAGAVSYFLRRGVHQIAGQEKFSQPVDALH